MPTGRVSIRVNRPGIDRLRKRYVLRVANAALNLSATKVNVDTGYLRSTRALEDNGDFVRLVYRAEYAAAVHDGWSRGGGGYSGNPYLTSAVAETLARYARG